MEKKVYKKEGINPPGERKTKSCPAVSKRRTVEEKEKRTQRTSVSRDSRCRNGRAEKGKRKGKARAGRGGSEQSRQAGSAGWHLPCEPWRARTKRKIRDSHGMNLSWCGCGQTFWQNLPETRRLRQVRARHAAVLAIETDFDMRPVTARGIGDETKHPCGRAGPV